MRSARSALFIQQLGFTALNDDEAKNHPLLQKPESNLAETGHFSSSAIPIGKVFDTRPFSRSDIDTEQIEKGLLGEYEILSEIAHGGMGVVYRARQIRADRIVALKLIRSSSPHKRERDRFLTEARAAARLDHPGIVPVYEVGEILENPFFSMRLIEGSSLAKRITDGPITPREAAQICVRIADAVEYAHQRMIIHRDLKPANVILDSNNIPYVAEV